VLEGGCVDGNEICRRGFGNGAGEVGLSRAWEAVEEGSVKTELLLEEVRGADGFKGG